MILYNIRIYEKTLISTSKFMVPSNLKHFLRLWVFFDNKSNDNLNQKILNLNKHYYYLIIIN